MTPTPTSGATDLRTAAQAVVDRWDTPLWKDVPATAEYIGRLRAALAAGQATAAQAGVPANMRLCYLCGHPADAHPWVNDPRGGKRRGDCPAAPAQPAAQQGAAYAELEKKHADFVETVGLMLAAIGYKEDYARQWPKEKASVTFRRWFDEQRASYGQAPAAPKGDIDE